MSSFALQAACATALRTLIEQVSEELYAASWHDGIEYAAWEQASKADVGELTAHHTPYWDTYRTMAILARSCDGWWTWPQGQDEPELVPLGEWQSSFRRWKEQA